MNLEIQRFFFPVSEKLPELAIPSSTAKNWIKFGVPDVVSIPELDFSTLHLILENERMKKDLAVANSKQDLALYSFRFFGLQVQFNRIKKIEDRVSFVEKVKSASQVLTLKVCLEVIGLSAVRAFGVIASSVAITIGGRRKIYLVHQQMTSVAFVCRPTDYRVPRKGKLLILPLILNIFI